jgi:hypothetical protein
MPPLAVIATVLSDMTMQKVPLNFKTAGGQAGHLQALAGSTTNISHSGGRKPISLINRILKTDRKAAFETETAFFVSFKFLLHFSLRTVIHPMVKNLFLFTKLLRNECYAACSLRFTYSGPCVSILLWICWSQISYPLRSR